VKRWSLSGFGVLAAALAAAAPLAAAPAVDTAKLDELRSLLAEAAALEAAQARGRVTANYARTIREDIGRDLGNLAAEPGLGSAARTGLAALQRHDAATLTRVRDLLVALERSNGRTY
jgi:hypothetical protein